MKDKDFIKLLEQVKKEFQKRIGRKVCKELHAGCFSCQTQWIIGLINYWIDILDES